MPYQAKRPPLAPCPVEEVMHLVAGKWKVRILYLLSVERCTFAELRRSLEGVTQQVLAAQLKSLTRDGLVGQERIVVGKSAHSRYSLSVNGTSLIPVLAMISSWGESRMLRRGVSWNPPVVKRAVGRHSRMAACE